MDLINGNQSGLGPGQFLLSSSQRAQTDYQLLPPLDLLAMKKSFQVAKVFSSYLGTSPCTLNTARSLYWSVPICGCPINCSVDKRYAYVIVPCNNMIVSDNMTAIIVNDPDPRVTPETMLIL